MKEILIINGSGGVGKDTFVDMLSRHAQVIHTSIVNHVKELAKYAGWDGKKTEKDRKFLSDLKVLIDNYNDGNYLAMRKIMQDFKEDRIHGEILCIDMREIDQIKKAQDEFGAKTVLVTRKSVPHITSNIADKSVYDMKYDFYIENDGTFLELEDKAKGLLEILKHVEFVEFTATYYISHPYGGKEKNLEEIDKIISLLSEKCPNMIFLSPVHNFGKEYEKTPHAVGVKKCLWLLSKCDGMLVFGDYESSEGCKEEIKFCEENNIPYYVVGNARLSFGGEMYARN